MLLHLGNKAICINPADAYLKTINKEFSDKIYKESIENGTQIIYDEDWENALVRSVLNNV